MCNSGDSGPNTGLRRSMSTGKAVRGKEHVYHAPPRGRQAGTHFSHEASRLRGAGRRKVHAAWQHERTQAAHHWAELRLVWMRNIARARRECMARFRLLVQDGSLRGFWARCGSSWEEANVRALSVFEDQPSVNDLANFGSTAGDPSRHDAHACLFRILATRQWRCRP